MIDETKIEEIFDAYIKWARKLPFPVRIIMLGIPPVLIILVGMAVVISTLALFVVAGVAIITVIAVGIVAAFAHPMIAILLVLLLGVISLGYAVEDHRRDIDYVRK